MGLSSPNSLNNLNSTFSFIIVLLLPKAEITFGGVLIMWFLFFINSGFSIEIDAPVSTNSFNILRGVFKLTYGSVFNFAYDPRLFLENFHFEIVLLFQ